MHNIEHLAEIDLKDFKQLLLRRLSSWKRLARLIRPPTNHNLGQSLLSVTKLNDAKKLFVLVSTGYFLEIRSTAFEQVDESQTCERTSKSSSLSQTFGALSEF